MPEKSISIVERDQFARFVGIELVKLSPGQATCRMVVRPEHLNGLGIVQGGAIFTLADITFAAACNSHDFASVAVNADISFLKAVHTGTITAHAEETSAGGKLGSCVVRLTDDAGDLVALFQGLSYRKSPRTPSAGATK